MNTVIALKYLMKIYLEKMNFIIILLIVKLLMKIMNEMLLSSGKYLE